MFGFHCFFISLLWLQRFTDVLTTVFAFFEKAIDRAMVIPAIINTQLGVGNVPERSDPKKACTPPTENPMKLAKSLPAKAIARDAVPIKMMNFRIFARIFMRMSEMNEKNTKQIMRI